MTKYFKLNKAENNKLLENSLKHTVGGHGTDHPPTQGRTGKFQTAVSFSLRKWERGKGNPV